MEITQEQVLAAYKRRLGDAMEQIVLLEALVATLQAEGEEMTGDPE